MQRIFRFFMALLGSLLICGAALAQDKVVYHIDNAEAQATKGLRNIRNHLDVAPETKIVVVTHADGVDFLMDGAKDNKKPHRLRLAGQRTEGPRRSLRGLRDHLEEPKPQEGTVQHGRRVHAFGRGAYRPAADPRKVRLYQALRPAPRPLRLGTQRASSARMASITAL